MRFRGSVDCNSLGGIGWWVDARRLVHYGDEMFKIGVGVKVRWPLVIGFLCDWRWRL